MSTKNKLEDFWHVRHSCGHSVYWNDLNVVGRVEASPCPWCGAENGDKLGDDVPMLHDPRGDILAFRELLPNGLVPWPSALKESVGGKVALRHKADNSCCPQT